MFVSPGGGKKLVKVTIQSIPPSGRSVEVVVDPGLLRTRLADRLDIERFAACRAELTAERIDQTVVLRGEIAVDVLFDCSRCAEAVEATLRFLLHMVLLPRPSRPGPVEDDVDTGYHNGRQIDLDRLIVDHVALAMPDVLLCDPSCRGLCLNEGPCRCGDERKG
jgi:uncharacterized metal-binding protein YceD (DUF177 family)